MAFTHLAKHIVFVNQFVIGAYEELDDAVAAAEAAASSPGEPPRAFIVSGTEILEV